MQINLNEGQKYLATLEEQRVVLTASKLRSAALGIRASLKSIEEHLSQGVVDIGKANKLFTEAKKLEVAKQGLLQEITRFLKAVKTKADNPSYLENLRITADSLRSNS